MALVYHTTVDTIPAYAHAPSYHPRYFETTQRQHTQKVQAYPSALRILPFRNRPRRIPLPWIQAGRSRLRRNRTVWNVHHHSATHPCVHSPTTMNAQNSIGTNPTALARERSLPSNTTNQVSERTTNQTNPKTGVSDHQVTACLLGLPSITRSDALVFEDPRQNNDEYPVSANIGTY